jgi:hypothetical protein
MAKVRHFRKRLSGSRFLRRTPSDGWYQRDGSRTLYRYQDTCTWVSAPVKIDGVFIAVEFHHMILKSDKDAMAVARSRCERKFRIDHNAYKAKVFKERILNES